MITKMFRVVRKFSVGELITLYTIDLTPQGGSVFRFTNNVFEERLPIEFGGQLYTYMPVAMEGIDVSSDSGPAQPRLMLATAGGPVNALLSNYNDLRGATVTRIRTFAEFLDKRPNGTGGLEVNPGADSAAQLPPDIFVVDRKVAANKTMAELQLVAPTDQEGIQLPLRTVKKRYCDKVYRIPNGSGGFLYAGRHNPCPWGSPVPSSGFYDTNDQPTTAANDRCSKTLRGCALRFGADSGLPFGGFPGVRAKGEP
jgi:lambda family phage minor tail protein L